MDSKAPFMTDAGKPLSINVPDNYLACGMRIDRLQRSLPLLRHLAQRLLEWRIFLFEEPEERISDILLLFKLHYIWCLIEYGGRTHDIFSPGRGPNISWCRELYARGYLKRAVQLMPQLVAARLFNRLARFYCDFRRLEVEAWNVRAGDWLMRDLKRRQELKRQLALAESGDPDANQQHQRTQMLHHIAIRLEAEFLGLDVGFVDKWKAEGVILRPEASFNWEDWWI